MNRLRWWWQALWVRCIILVFLDFHFLFWYHIGSCLTLQVWVQLPILISEIVNHAVMEHEIRYWLHLCACKLYILDLDLGAVVGGRPQEQSVNFTVANVALMVCFCICMPFLSAWDIEGVAQLPCQNQVPFLDVVQLSNIRKLLFLAFDFLDFHCLRELLCSRRFLVSRFRHVQRMKERRHMETLFVSCVHSIQNFLLHLIWKAKVTWEMQANQWDTVFNQLDDLENHIAGETTFWQVEVPQFRVLKEKLLKVVDHILLILVESVHLLILFFLAERFFEC